MVRVVIPEPLLGLVSARQEHTHSPWQLINDILCHVDCSGLWPERPANETDGGTGQLGKACGFCQCQGLNPDLVHFPLGTFVPLVYFSSSLSVSAFNRKWPLSDASGALEKVDGQELSDFWLHGLAHRHLPTSLQWPPASLTQKVWLLYILCSLWNIL